MTIRELAPRIRDGSVSPVELTAKTLERISRINPEINAFITILSEPALKDAERAEKLAKEGVYLGPLHGIPISIKDVFYCKGVRCTAGSKILSNHIPDSDSEVVRRLKEAGAIIVGTNNLHEFSCGGTSMNPTFGAVRNPWSRDRIAGGSSGGSAAAVASRSIVSAIGTDAGGSVRNPAALCGVVGFKPTYGRVSVTGVVPLTYSFDHVGTLTTSVWDAAATLQVIAQGVLEDQTGSDSGVRYVEEIERPIGKVRVGVPRRYFFDILHSDVKNAFERYLDRLATFATIVDVQMDQVERVFETWRCVRLAETAAVHTPWFESRKSDYGQDVRESIELGLAVTAVEYISALNVKREITRAFLENFKSVDLLTVPSTPITAPRIGGYEVDVDGKVFDYRSILHRLSLPFNLVGAPSISIPIGLGKDNLPIGAQIIGKKLDEAGVLRFAHEYERTFGLIGEPPTSLGGLQHE